MMTENDRDKLVWRLRQRAQLSFSGPVRHGIQLKALLEEAAGQIEDDGRVIEKLWQDLESVS